MKPRTLYKLSKYNERDGYVEFAQTTSAALAGTILRACERQAAGNTIYEVRPALPAHVSGDGPTAAQLGAVAIENELSALAAR